MIISYKLVSKFSTHLATLANGCFWCSEAIFKRLKGIKSVLPGYSGGIVKDDDLSS